MIYFTRFVVSVIYALTFTGIEGLYSTKDPVKLVNHLDFERIIRNTNHTSIVEFFAPWCGHCKQLKPTYLKVGKQLQDYVQVAAIDCDDEKNKPICSKMGVKGFPTLKIFSRNRKGAPMIKEYNDARTVTAITENTLYSIPNHVERLNKKNINDWLKEKNDTAKLMVFSDKDAISPLIRSLAIDFLGQVSFGVVKSTDDTIMSTFGVYNVPTIILLPGGDKPGLIYNGQAKRLKLFEFITQVSMANRDALTQDYPEKLLPPPSAQSKSSNKKKDLPFEQGCLQSDSPLCLVVLLPLPGSGDNAITQDALKSVEKVYQKYSSRGKKLFDLSVVSINHESFDSIGKAMNLPEDNVNVILISGKKSWWARYDKPEFTFQDVDEWIDLIRLGQGIKQNLPSSLLGKNKSKDSGKSSSAEPHDEL